MKVLWVTGLSIALSAVGIALLASQNAKRRRSAGFEPRTQSRNQTIAAYVFILAPLPVLIAHGQTSPFILWFAVLSVIGWWIALRQPS